LLTWYDNNRRILPWRATQGQKPDIYHVWLSEIMLQQTVVNAVIPYFLKFVEKWPTIHDLAAATQEDVMAAWAGLGYYARARNLHKCAKQISREQEGIFPDDEAALGKLPGIGSYTSAAITAIAYDRPSNVVDGNVERIMARYFAVTEPLPAAKKQLHKLAAYLSEGQLERPGDYAQALMDLGATICTPKSPKCAFCPLKRGCKARAENIAAELPYKITKGNKPQKKGYVYWITNEKGEVLFERRPQKGLLGGMIGLPTSAWVGKTQKPAHLSFIKTGHKDYFYGPALPKIYHSFTHFGLELTLVSLKVNTENFAENNKNRLWIPSARISDLGLPTLFKKVTRIRSY